MMRTWTFWVVAFAVGAGVVWRLAGTEEPTSARAPAAVTSLPVPLICSGGADVPWAFSFHGHENGLRVHFSDEESSPVVGNAKISLRGEDDFALFEGVVALVGTRTADARLYRLEGRAGDRRLSMELVHGGTGTLLSSVDGKSAERYEAHCQTEPR